MSPAEPEEDVVEPEPEVKEPAAAEVPAVKKPQAQEDPPERLQKLAVPWPLMAVSLNWGSFLWVSS